MTSLLRLPLHYQILIALALGTVVGALLNPGEVEFQGPLRGQIERTDDGLVLTETAPGDKVLVEVALADVAALERRFPSLAGRYEQAGAPDVFPFDVTNARAHIVESGRNVTLRYTREQAGHEAITPFAADTPEQFVETFPRWAEIYRQHGGGTRRQIAIVARHVGDIFLRLLQMVTVPLILTSLVTGVASLGGTSRFGAMFGKTLLYYATTSILAIGTGLLMVNLIQPGEWATLPGGGEPVAGGGESLGGIFLGLIEKMIPANPFAAIAEAEFLSIITFSILIGVCIIYVGGPTAELLRNLFQAGFEVMMRLTMAIIALAPIGVFAFMLYATATQGWAIFAGLAGYMLTVFLALAVHACVVLPLIVKFVGRRSPWQFAQAMSPALMTAFSTASSNATLPLTITSAEQRAGISNRVSSFVLPLGATVNMDGTALYEAVAVLFISQAYAAADPTFTLTFGQQVLVAITALLASVGAAGIPHAGLVMMAIVLQAVGLPLDAQGIIIAVDRVLDMCRTAVNVWSDSCGCAVLGRFEESAAVDVAEGV